jgi:hypothetical protein
MFNDLIESLPAGRKATVTTRLPQFDLTDLVASSSSAHDKIHRVNTQ